ncbi:murein biosynthesis integral membrane protein MurJ [Neochlamydia sp. AcF95]|uniref:murein biosynthesis integral membrane protein MurJ n=1 Tax=Neochlamydia sp. AcF95 TaxID=2795734 RepID=UPI001BC8D30D|nr:murein biosynthesis integral membrane protein MurJ [Neochlamydia sp. AcF95]MBS4171644.1 putative lipid II flippase MurJ [Neochlamydia sp. AcF95]
MTDSTHSIIRSAKRFFSGTMLSRMTGMVRDITMASAFGTQPSIAAFLVAFRLSHLLRRLLGEGALQSAFIPQFEKLRYQDPQRAAAFFRSLTLALSILLSVLVILSMALLWGVLMWANLDEGNAEIAQLTLLMMPSLIFICLYGMNASLLQCEKSFFTASVAPAAFNLLWIVGILCLKNLPSKEAMRGLTLFVNLACLAQWAVTLHQTKHCLKALGRNFASPFKNIFSQDILSLLSPLSLGIIGVGAAQINNALDAVFARYADAAGPAYLWYAMRLQQLPLALFSLAIAAATLPPLARAIKNGDKQLFNKFLDFSLRKSVALMLPISTAIFALGTSSITLIYGHGGFNQQAVANTALCLGAYGLGLFPMSLVLILVPAFYAQDNYKIPTQISIASILLNLILNLLLVFVFERGAASVALATSISAWMNMFLLLYKLEEKSGYVFSPKLKTSLWKISCVSLLAMLASLTFSHYWLAESSWMLGKESVFLQTRSSLQQLSLFALQALTFLFSLVGASYLLQVDDILKIHRSESPLNS